MLSALGLGKKKTPSGSDITKHQSQYANFVQWRSDVQRLETSANRLAQDYSQHKGDFALGRYEELKAMIKTAVKEYEEVMIEIQKRPPPSSSVYAQKYSGPPKDKGAMSKLREHAANFAGAPAHASSDNSNTITWFDQKSKTVDEDISKIQREVVHLKKQFRIFKDKLERLAKEYEDSKKYNPTQRYSILKLLIKDTIRDV